MGKRDGALALVSYSDEVLESERRALMERIAVLDRRVEAHRSVLQQLEAELASVQHLLREIEELTERRPQLRI